MTDLFNWASDVDDHEVLIPPGGEGCQGKFPVARLFAEGERAMIVTGRMTTPFPRIDFSTNRKATNTLDRVHSWLVDNAIEEAFFRHDRFNHHQFGSIDAKRITPAEKDGINLYLFDNILGPFELAYY